MPKKTKYRKKMKGRMTGSETRTLSKVPTQRPIVNRLTS